MDPDPLFSLDPYQDNFPDPDPTANQLNSIRIRAKMVLDPDRKISRIQNKLKNLFDFK